MFDELLKTMKENISTVRSLIQTNEKLRDILFGRESTSENNENEFLDLTSLKTTVPKIEDWRVYDHCSVVTRLYAIYENFVESLIKDWIIELPNLISSYLDLPEVIRGTHQIGVANLLLELKKKKNRYEHLSIDLVIRGLYFGHSSINNQYDLIPDAFLFHDQNLRKDALQKLFAEVGISEAWKWIEQHRSIKFFVEETLANENTAEGELKELIDYRNEAAHGAIIDNVLGYKKLLDLCDFIEALCQALTELVIYHILERQKSIRKVKDIGKITEWFKKPKAGVAKIINANLSVGDRVFLVDLNKSYCQVVKIESIRLNNISQEKISITLETEVGLKFDQDARNDVRLYIDVTST
ncbi:conserved hypothetical protein [Gloeothece citriformis PCC 7424]|uniref:RiboL-PSP-HEPN domain-containing protein n=1 Tax=Gloeothece citriformis (strain PCC 7424) TaxID=65393 RepID=B7KLM1_GLOC7|nr:MAE_28990/MAE_18760 family HEPN-like nuclease [Gloeothece citriformis]ACK72593.1 conserved hypothetical protein [Gloeothece citriformis PCC 7424]